MLHKTLAAPFRADLCSNGNDIRRFRIPLHHRVGRLKLFQRRVEFLRAGLVSPEGALELCWEDLCGFWRAHLASPIVVGDWNQTTLCSQVDCRQRRRRPDAWTGTQACLAVTYPDQVHGPVIPVDAILHRTLPSTRRGTPSSAKRVTHIPAAMSDLYWNGHVPRPSCAPLHYRLCRLELLGWRVAYQERQWRLAARVLRGSLEDESIEAMRLGDWDGIDDDPILGRARKLA
uniref:Uncharacterized protein n=1 Tax=Mycena chlorophos TaxID=658473 RepID=A0ABQ0KV27_MYCCL|nr:predicted protein [Mycena chlorophos]